ncbi:MAG: OsmC family protein [Solirubrobacteraceae bacterium]
MDRAQLRAAQKPIKARYRNEPETALVTLHAEGRLDQEEIACSVATGRALVQAGLHPATGGSGMLACSGDMLLQALVACAGVTLRSVATSLQIPVTGTVSAEGDLDFRGTLGVAPDGEAPVGFRAIRLRFDLHGDATEEQLTTLMRLTERYCVVYQTLTGGVAVTVSRSGREG